MSNYQRRKGHNWEREVAGMLREVFPGETVRRGLQSREGGAVPDVECPILWVECKCGARPNPRAALEQAERGCPRGRIPVAIIKDSQPLPGQVVRPFAVLALDDLLEILTEWWARRDR